MSKVQVREQGETENAMVAEAQRLVADTGQRKFWRENPMLRLHYSQTVEFLRAKSRGGDLTAVNDLEALERQNGILTQIKKDFYFANSISEKKAIAAKYKVEEAKMMGLLSSPNDAEV